MSRKRLKRKNLFWKEAESQAGEREIPGREGWAEETKPAGQTGATEQEEAAGQTEVTVQTEVTEVEEETGRKEASGLEEEAGEKEAFCRKRAGAINKRGKTAIKTAESEKIICQPAFVVLV